jgi:3-oxoacyl-[acyl-carrier-protein] synthase-3
MSRLDLAVSQKSHPHAPLAIRIMGTGQWSGGREVPTAELLAQAMPGRDPARMTARIGIESRRWANSETTIADMGAEALRAALEDAGTPPSDLCRVIVTCSTGGDLLIPGAAVDVAHQLGIGDRAIDAFDLSNSCAGYMSGFNMAARAVATGDGPIALISVEQFSRFIRPEEPRCYVIFGDAAVATVLGPSSDDAALMGAGFKILSAPGERIEVRHGGRTGRREYIDFAALSSDALTEQALAALEVAVQVALDQAGLGVDDLDWVLPHQPNGEMLARFAVRLGVSEDRMVPIVDRAGSIGVAAVPLSLHTLRRSGRLGRGQHILMASVGSGTVAGALVYRT